MREIENPIREIKLTSINVSIYHDFVICKGFRVYLSHWWFHRYEAWYHLHINNDHVGAWSFPSITIKSRQKDRALKQILWSSFKTEIPPSFLFLVFPILNYRSASPSVLFVSVMLVWKTHHYDHTLCRYGNIICSMLRFFSKSEENFLVSKYCKNSIFISCDLGQWSSPTKENQFLHILWKVLPTKGFT